VAVRVGAAAAAAGPGQCPGRHTVAALEVVLVPHAAFGGLTNPTVAVCVGAAAAAAVRSVCRAAGAFSCPHSHSPTNRSCAGSIPTGVVNRDTLITGSNSCAAAAASAAGPVRYHGFERPDAAAGAVRNVAAARRSVCAGPCTAGAPLPIPLQHSDFERPLTLCHAAVHHDFLRWPDGPDAAAVCSAGAAAVRPAAAAAAAAVLAGRARWLPHGPVHPRPRPLQDARRDLTA
jgi:hypothetical protein